MFLVIYLLKLLYKLLVLKRSRSTLNTHLPQVLSTSIVAMRVLYLQITRNALDVFNCQVTDPSDGKTYMSGNIDTPCYVSGSAQMTLLPMGVCAMLFYTIGLPGAAVWWLRKNRYKVKLDQLLRAKGMGEDRITNPYYSFRKTWKNLYQYYKPQTYLWDFVVLLKKGLIVVSSLLFRSSPSYQLAMNLLILFVVLVFSLKKLPYLSPSQKIFVIEEHARLLLTDQVHIQMEAEICAVSVKNRMARKSSGTTFDRLLRRRNDASSRIVLQVFDYNTVDSTLLSVCVLINLFAVMLASERFVGVKALLNGSEYSTITAALIILIVSGLVYYVIALVFDIMIVICPESLRALTCSVNGASQGGASALKRPSLVSSQDRKKLQTARANLRTMQNLSPVTSSIKTSSANGGVGMSVNPFLQARLSRSSKVMRQGSDESTDSMIESVLSFELPPEAEQWLLVKQLISKLQQNVGDLQGLLKEQVKFADRRSISIGSKDLPEGTLDKTKTANRPVRSSEVRRSMFLPAGFSDEISEIKPARRPARGSITSLTALSNLPSRLARTASAAVLLDVCSALQEEDSKAVYTNPIMMAGAGTDKINIDSAAQDKAVAEPARPIAEPVRPKGRGTLNAYLLRHAQGTVKISAPVRRQPATSGVLISRRPLSSRCRRRPTARQYPTAQAIAQAATVPSVPTLDYIRADDPHRAI